MFAFKVKPGSAEFLQAILDVPAFEVNEGVTYYVISDPDTQAFVVTEEELAALEETDGEPFIRFQ